MRPNQAILDILNLLFFKNNLKIKNQYYKIKNLKLIKLILQNHKPKLIFNNLVIFIYLLLLFFT